MFHCVSTLVVKIISLKLSPRNQASVIGWPTLLQFIQDSKLQQGQGTQNHEHLHAYA